MAKALVVALAVLRMLVLTSTARAAEPRPIRDVSTMAELRATEPIITPDGWEIHVGMHDESATLPMTRIFYLAKFTGKRERPGRTRAQGPVSVEAQWEGATTGFQEAFVPLRPPWADGLYCRSFARIPEHACTIEIRAADGSLLAARRLISGPQEPSLWMPLAELHVRDEQTEAAVQSRAGYRVCPIESGEHVLLEPADGSLAYRQGITLAVAGDQITVEFPEEAPFPDGTGLLARWWLNGKPVTPSVEAMSIGKMYQGRDTTTRRATLTAFVPDRQFRPGDRVSLQVLASSEGWEYYHMLKTLSHRTGGRPFPMPMLSNRIDFVVTEAMMVPPLEPTTRSAASSGG